MLSKLRSLGAGALGIVFMLVGVSILVLLTMGATWVSIVALPWLMVAVVLTFLITILVLLPLSFVRPTRTFASFGLLAASYVFGVATLAWSVITVYSLWGGFWLFVGLVMAGFGTIPMALAAMLFKGMWSPLFQMLLLIVLTWAIRVYSFYVSAKADDESAQIMLSN